MLSVTHLCPILCDPVDCSPPESMGFSRQEYWSGVPFRLPGDLPDPVIACIPPASPVLAGRIFSVAPPGKPLIHLLASTKSAFPIFRLGVGRILLLSTCMWNTEEAALGGKILFHFTPRFLRWAENAVSSSPSPKCKHFSKEGECTQCANRWG